MTHEDQKVLLLGEQTSIEVECLKPTWAEATRISDGLPPPLLVNQVLRARHNPSPPMSAAFLLAAEAKIRQRIMHSST